MLIEEERRKTVAQRLELVVDQTQQLSQAVAASFAPSTPPPEREEDAEFAAGGDEDELATLLEAEGQEEEGEVAREVDALQQEAEMDIEALLAQYGGYRLEGSEEEDLEEEEQEEEEREEAEEKVAVKAEPRPAAAEPPVKRQKGEAATAAAEGDYKEEADEDELATLLEAEGQEEEGEVAKEVDALQQEAEMDIEALLAQYGGYRRGVASEDEQEEGDEEEEEEEEGGADEEDNEDASDEQLAEECLKEGEVLPFGTAEMLAAEGDEEAGRAVMERCAALS